MSDALAIAVGANILYPADFAIDQYASRYFWPHVDRTGDCWIWRGGLGIGDRFKLTYRGEVMEVHRFAYLFAHDDLDPGMDVVRWCGEAACVRHLSARPHGRRLVDEGECRRGHPWRSNWLAGSDVCRSCRNEDEAFEKERGEWLDGQSK